MVRRLTPGQFMMRSRRELIGRLLGARLFRAKARPEEERVFRLWAFGDAHVGSDKRFGRDSLAEALAQSEFGGKEGGSPFEWDIAVNVGDMSGAQASPADEEGEEVIHQFGVLRKHRREDIYDICGNHDRSALDKPDASWFRKWLDPPGENTAFSGVDPARRRYQICGNWERYSFRVGNLLFLMMSDRNEPTQKVGRGPLGGNPGGVVSAETFEWWKKMIEANPESIIISAHHYVLKDTTVASGEWEGIKTKDASGRWRPGYHGYYVSGTPRGASYLYWVGGEPDAQAFEKYLEARPGAVAMWLGGHTHTNPDDAYGGKSHIEHKWGVHFLNVAALAQHHTKPHTVPMSRLLTFREGSAEVRVQCYLHTSRYAPQGWYPRAERTLRIARAFQGPDSRADSAG